MFALLFIYNLALERKVMSSYLSKAISVKSYATATAEIWTRDANSNVREGKTYSMGTSVTI